MIENLRNTLRENLEDRDARVKHCESALRTGKIVLKQPFREENVSKASRLLRDELILGINTAPVLTPQTMRDAFNLWIKSAVNPKTQRARTSFYELMKKLNILEKAFLDCPFIAERLLIRLSKAFSTIQNTKMNTTSKESYFCYIRKIRDFVFYCISRIDKTLWNPEREFWDESINKLNANSPKLTRRIIAEFLDFLEQDALKSSSIRRYEAILLSQTLIYAPLPGQQLLALRAPNKQHMYLQSHDQRFQVPESFVKFWECFGETEHLFPASLRNWRPPENRIHKRIERLGKRAKLPISITPTMLRSVREAYFP